MFEKLRNIKDEVLYWILYCSILVGVAVFLYGLVIIKFYNPNDRMAYVGLGIAILSMFASVIISNDSARNFRKDRRAERKVEIISSVKSDEIKGKIEYLYKNILHKKSIDKIEIVNTSIGQNDNRKDVIIIYH